ncbi:hypothetical protein CRG98_012737, partial [Punica granatum]
MKSGAHVHASQPHRSLSIFILTDSQLLTCLSYRSLVLLYRAILLCSSCALSLSLSPLPSLFWLNPPFMVDDTNVIAAPKAACIPNICEVFSFLSTKPKSKPDNKILSSDEYSKRKLSWKQQPEAVTVVTTDDVTSCSSLKVESEGIQEFYSTNQEEDNSNMNGFHNFGFNINNDFHREGHSPHGMFFRDRSRRATDSFSHFTS